jgi:hypothetical protein
MRARRVFVLIVLALLPAGLVQAGSPAVRTQVRLDDADGFVAVAEEVTPAGAVIDTFRSGDVTLKVIGSPGSAVKAQRAEGKGDREGISLELSTSRPKKLGDVDAYARSGRTVVGDLVALGMPADEARAQFGDMEVADPAAAAATRRLASSVLDPETFAAIAAPTPSSTKPYDTQCASVSYQNGIIEGYGCSTIYLVAASGGDWWFNNKYKFSARSNDGSFYLCIPGTCPWRLYEVGWSIAWSTNNIVYDWEPSATVDQGGCSPVTLGATYHGFGISISGTICPRKMQPWNLSGRKSGAEWLGLEQGTAWEATIGIQAVHSPPNAAASYSSPLTLSWIRWNT